MAEDSGAPPLFTRLLDDASLFPPGNAPMDRAIAEHRAHERSGRAALVGPFVCPDTRIAELVDELGSQPSVGALPVSVVVTGGPSCVEAVRKAVGEESAVSLVSLEVPLGAGEGAAGRATEAAAGMEGPLPGVVGYLEVPRGDELEQVLDVLVRHGLRAKLRTGGPAPSSFPSDTEVASFIQACASRQLAFKCTAGLHKGVRHDLTAGEGGEVMEQQGFLNIVLATSASLEGATIPEMAALLAERDETSVTKAVGGLVPAQVIGARGRFLSFGTCSVAEPIADLVRLGLLGPQFATP